MGKTTTKGDTAAQEPVTSQPDYLSAALAAYDAGLDPTPIRPGTRKPAIKWKKRDKRIPRKKVAKYWKQYPDHEVAILLNDDLFVCDADTPEAVTALYQLEEDLNLTPKVIVQTARGEHHYFFRAPGTTATTYAPDKAKHPDGIDIKTGHTLLIIPPSTGKKYLQGDITALASLTEVKQPQIDAFDQHNGRRGPQELPCSPIAPKLPPPSVKSSKPRKGKKKAGLKKIRSAIISNIEDASPIDPASFPNTKVDSRGNRVPLGTIRNIRHMLDHYGIQAWYDIIAKKVMIIIPGLSGSPDNADNAALAHLVSLATLNGISTSHIGDFVLAISNSHQYNPVAEWILSKSWDGKDRLEDFYATITTASDYPEELKRILLYRWLLSAVAAAFTPSGFSSRGVLVLQGAQGIGKTRWIRNTVSDPVLQERVIKTDHHLDASKVDSKKTALSHWMVELGELESSFKKDTAQLKGFITGSMDKFRLPYAKTDSEFSRRTVFCATVNKSDFLVDDTGNTRWWTIPATDIDYDHGIDMQQVFAEVYTLFTYGQQWWLTDAEEALLEDHNKNHQATSAIRDILESNVDFSKKTSSAANPVMSATDILKTLGIQNPNTSQTRECGVVLRDRLGEPSKSNGKRGWRIAFHPTVVDSTIY